MEPVDSSVPYNLTRAGKAEEALALYEQWPENTLFRRRKAELCLLTGRKDELRALLERAPTVEHGEILGALWNVVMRADRFSHYDQALEPELRLFLAALRGAKVDVPAPVLFGLYEMFPEVRWHDVFPRTRSQDAVPSPPVEHQQVEGADSERTVQPAAKRLQWEILPAGYIGSFLQGSRTVEEAANGVEREHLQRLRLLDTLQPHAWYQGSELGARIYLVAVFGDLAIADSADYGSALYWFRGPDSRWKTVFRRNKREAVRLGAKRIVHAGDWEERVRRLVAG